ncbi:MAG: bifunctional (p)ppGpp synthetase/guanosine-3',5'-bis(diphosphate) 3'-pyrophosphohydrolase [Alphaproteobacteria bacterium]|nr:bifunctional (p)ppGpp synthetase/guanosine-3',5'-bis(diphosphate) 3'-pyrophosphohydrolase [Alphaproteobacteria bacterium]
MLRQFELVERVKTYDPNADEDALDRAYVYAVKKHGSQLRASGDPYFSHPVEVAGILTNFKLDAASIITGLLHDVVEDTGTSLDEIRELFGDEVATLVDGVTKLSRIELRSSSAANKQAENFRKFVVAMSTDIRVLLIKLADRLHNMRTLEFIKSEDKRRRIALETAEIYAPLSGRIGMQEIKTELDDLAFEQLHPDSRTSIIARLEYLRTKGGDIVPNTINKIKETLKESGIDCIVHGREKTPYSIWQKMQNQNINFEQVADIIAFRIIVKTVEECYLALGAIHTKYTSVGNDKIKDYISGPKPNGYQSLHTTVIGPFREPIEVQIRTEEMHEISEKGVAAHWVYKQGNSKNKEDKKQFRWLRELLEILEHASDPEEFLENTKLEMFHEQVFCFTPNGDLITLPKGSTPVDFAYAVHSQVGNRCVGAKINGIIANLRTDLQNGDQVEILTSKQQKPSPEWETFVVTGKAKANIKKFTRAAKRSNYIDQGRQNIYRAFRKASKEYSDKLLKDVPQKFNLETIDDLFASIGEGSTTANEVINQLFPEEKPSRVSRVMEQIKRVSTSKRFLRKKKKSEHHDSVPISGVMTGMSIHLAKCCHPIPGDKIAGIITTGKGVTIHAIDCPILERFKDAPERWLDVQWKKTTEETFLTCRLKVILENALDSIPVLSTIIAQNEGNITNIIFGNSGDLDYHEVSIDIEVQNTQHLSTIIAALRAETLVNSVERIRK